MAPSCGALSAAGRDGAPGLIRPGADVAGRRSDKHLGGLPVHLEVEGELARSRGDERAENRPERRAALQFRVHLPDHGHVGEADEALVVDDVRAAAMRLHFCSVFR